MQAFHLPNGKKLIALLWYLKGHDRQTIMWDVEPETYLGFDAGAQEIVDYTVSKVRSGSIILVHPLNNNGAARDAIPVIVARLQKQGSRL